MDVHALTTGQAPILRVRFRAGRLLEVEAIDIAGLVAEFADLDDDTAVAEIVRGLLTTGSFDDLTWEQGMTISYHCERPEALAAQLSS